MSSGYRAKNLNLVPFYTVPVILYYTVQLLLEVAMQESNNNLAILLILIFIFAITTAAWFGFNAGWVMSQKQIQGTVLSEEKTTDAFALIDNKQRSFTLQNLKDKWSILFFGYTHCADDCPTTMDTLKQVHVLL
jgi:protein SCO1/2